MAKPLYHLTYQQDRFSWDILFQLCRPRCRDDFLSARKKLCNSGDPDYIGRFRNSGPVYKLVILSRYGYPCNTGDEPKSIDFTVTSWFCGLTHYTHENNSVPPMVVCFFLSRWNAAPSNLVDYQRFTKHKRIFSF